MRSIQDTPMCILGLVTSGRASEKAGGGRENKKPPPPADALPSGKRVRGTGARSDFYSPIILLLC